MSAVLKEVNKYYASDDIPEIFLEADKVMYGSYEEDEDITNEDDNVTSINDFKKKKNKSKKKDSNDQNKSDKKEKKKKEKSQKEYEVEIIQLMAQIDYIKHKLSRLDPGKRRDSQMIAAMNVALIDIKDRIKELEQESGIHISSLDNGSRIGRFVSKLKYFKKRVVKKAKKFYKRNKEMVLGVGAIVVPFVLSLILKLLPVKK